MAPQRRALSVLFCIHELTDVHDCSLLLGLTGQRVKPCLAHKTACPILDSWLRMTAASLGFQQTIGQMLFCCTTQESLKMKFHPNCRLHNWSFCIWWWGLISRAVSGNWNKPNKVHALFIYTVSVLLWKEATQLAPWSHIEPKDHRTTLKQHSEITLLTAWAHDNQAWW